VRQAKIVVRLEHGQLLTQSGFLLAQCIDPTPNRHHMLTKIQI
jgi:hypothetical protein